MRKPINLLEIRIALARILRQAVAVPLPIELDDRQKRSRESLFERIEPVYMRPALSRDEADALAREALKAAKSRFES